VRLAQQARHKPTSLPSLTPEMAGRRTPADASAARLRVAARLQPHLLLRRCRRASRRAAGAARLSLRGGPQHSRRHPTPPRRFRQPSYEPDTSSSRSMPCASAEAACSSEHERAKQHPRRPLVTLKSQACPWRASARKAHQLRLTSRQRSRVSTGRAKTSDGGELAEACQY